ncbi:GNAT family N-acetyltransferase [Pseudooceanicola sp.]|uniref:GNAT family N-acetyltransferase n=1 Tax=Pseudooceanicola sp. TaxID=1914328 RepID=UPI0026372398|nr:GNAT family N-acetyltransferase [Pseudooceanicola sp.]MDF1855187.1 GNAT family N-acetyltransferase [Pseudooceanicola sp.]
MIIVEPGDPGSPAARHLLGQSHALMRAEFPAESNHFLSIDALTAANIRFLIARRGAVVIGCAALALCEGYGEVKSMFVDPAARGSGAAKALMRALEDLARAEDLPLIRLETGDTLHAAQALYRAHGFATCGPFGAYREDPRSVFMEKRLT